MFAEFENIYTNDTDTHNVDFAFARTTRVYTFTEAAAGSTDTGYCTEQKTVTDPYGTTETLENPNADLSQCCNAGFKDDDDQ
jgi:hypothetical protein